jgi:hypothetical protein
MNAIDVTQFRIVPFSAERRDPHDPADARPEIVRTASGALYEREVRYMPHVPPLELPSRTSPLLAHAFRKAWWAAWWYRDDRAAQGEGCTAERVAKLVALAGGTAGNDERVAWSLIDLVNRVVLAAACDLAGLHGHAVRLRAMPPLSATTVVRARRLYRQIERDAEKIAPRSKHRAETEVDRALDRGWRGSGLLALDVALIGCDVRTGDGGWFGATVPHDAGEWPAVRRARNLVDPIAEHAVDVAWRAVAKVATLEQAQRFAEQIDELAEDFLRNLPRSRRAANKARA